MRGSSDPSAGLMVLADDLTGAAECAGYMLSASPVVSTIARIVRPGESLCIDLDTRHRSAQEAAQRVSAAVSLSTGYGGLIVKKIDSLLRGNVAAELGAISAAGRDLVVASALPAEQRAVIDGRVVFSDPDAGFEADRVAEGSPQSLDIREVLPARAGIISLQVTRGGEEGLSESILRMLREGRIPVCDCVTQADLVAIASASQRLARPICMAGTAALAGALTGGRNVEHHQTLPRPRRPVTFVIGSRSATAREQLAAFAPGDVDAIITPPTDDGRVDPLAIRRVVREHRSVIEASGVVVLSGGDTARAVFDALRIRELTAVGRLDGGAVLLSDEAGRLIITKPGSHGGSTALLQIAEWLRRRLASNDEEGDVRDE